MAVALDYDTKMFVRKQPGGMFSIRDAEDTPGRVFWVGSNVTGATDAAGYGENPGAPFATLVYAETQALTQRGDRIIILPNHTETLLSATGAAILTLDVANLRISGMGRSTRPAFLIDGHANNYVTITGADTILENVTFKAGHANIAKGISAAAAGVAFKGCHFIENTTNENFLFPIQTTAAADEMLVDLCKFISVNAAADACIQLVGACNGVEITNNYMDAPCVTSLIEAITTACLDIKITDNYLRNIAEGDDLAGLVDLVAGSTGVIHRNTCYLADDTDVLTGIDGANCSLADNISSNEYNQHAVTAGGVAA